MRVMGFLIERVNGVRIGSLQSAIEDLQGRVALAERRLDLKAAKAEAAAVSRAESDEAVAEVLGAGPEATAEEPGPSQYVGQYHRR